MNSLDLLKPVAYPSAYPELPFRVRYDWRAEDLLSWDGRALAGKGRTREEILHEAAHYWVASAKQLSRPEFGLGPNAATPSKYRYAVERARCLSLKECWRQEEEASMLQVVIMRHQGLDIRKTLDAHGWLDMVEVEYNRKEALREFKKIAETVLKRLVKKKLIDTNLRPLL